MPDNSPPYSKGSAYSLDSYSEGWVRSDAGEGPNSVPFLPIPERSRVLTYSSAPVQHGEALPLEEDDDHILVDWDSQGNTNAWVNKYTSADPQELFEPVLTCRTAPSEDGMEGYVLNNAGEYVLAGESLSTPGGATTDLWPPQEHDLPSRDLSSASSSSSSSLSWAPRASMGDRDRSSTRSEGDLGTIRGDLESSKVTRGQMLSQDIPVATRRYRRIVMDSSSSEDAREPPSTKNSSHRSQAGEERARRLFFYDGRESQGSSAGKTSRSFCEGSGANFPDEGGLLWSDGNVHPYPIDLEGVNVGVPIDGGDVAGKGGHVFLSGGFLAAGV